MQIVGSSGLGGPGRGPERPRKYSCLLSANSTTPMSTWLKLQQTTEYHHEPRGYHRTIKGVSSSYVLVHITGKMAAVTAILMLDKHMDVANVFVLFAWPKSPLSGVHVDRREMATSRV
ncbi:hypothetical protein RUM44_009270 [Polyplax serrata]|uniref:Uncharacterized protein n=1 Tax=Polyplax serrata TaxID=468196 RepID=A0ABR1ASG2_POLSC